MLTIRGVEIVDAFINPMFNWGNDPYLNIVVKDKIQWSDDSMVYEYKDGLWYYQNPVDGYTSFYSHNDEMVLNGERNGLPHYISKKNLGGFGGARVRIRAYNYYVTLLGPWSSGTYYANEILPLHSMECTVRDGNHNISTCLTLEQMNKILHLFAPYWTAEVRERYNHKFWSTLLWQGKEKKDIPKEHLEIEQFFADKKIKRYSAV